MDRRRPHGAGEESGLLEQGQASISTASSLKPLPDAQSRFASLQSGEADIVWDDEYDADNIQKAQKDPKLTVHTYAGSGAAVYAFNTKVAAVRRRARAPGAGDGARPQEDVAGDHQRPRRPASNPYGDGSWVKCKDDGALPDDLEKAKALIKDYGKPVEFKMLVTATPRGRTIGQVLQQFWKQVGANMEIEQVDQATIPPRAFMRQFQLTPWRIVDLADPDPQMYANFHTGSPVALANYSNPELDKLLEHARVTADTGQAHRGLLRDQPADQQGGDLVLDLPEHLLRDLEREGEGPAEDVQRGDRRIATPGWNSRSWLFFVARRLLYLLPVLIAVSLLTFLIASLLPGDLAYVDPRRPGDAGERRGVARTTWGSISRSGGAISAGSAMCCRAISAARSAPARPCCRRWPSGCRCRSS